MKARTTKVFLLTLAMALVPFAASAEDEVSLISTLPVGPSGTGPASYNFEVYIDKTKLCASRAHDIDHSPINEPDSLFCHGAITAGRHVLDITLTPDVGHKIHLTGVVVLRPGDEQTSDPMQPKGFGYWCVAVSRAQVKLMSKSDRRCQNS